MSDPTEYRRQAWRNPDSARPILVQPGRTEYAMGEERALMLLRELDEALHPWGEPGEVPADVGLYYISGDVEEVATRTPDEWYVDGKRRSIAQMKVDATTYGYCFRARWDPEPPRG